MTDTTAKIRAKGCDATGLTEDIAGDMYRNKGRRYMAIVELKVEETHEKADGNRKVDLVMTLVEPAEDSNLDEHLRELTRTLHFNRAIDQDQPTLDGGDGINPKVEDVIRAGVRHRPHPFLPVDAADDNGICDVCGLVDAAGVHSTQDFLPTDDPEDEDEDDTAAAIDAAYDEFDGPHAYDAGPDDVCQCGLPFEDDTHNIHQAGHEPTVTEVAAAQDRATKLAAVPDPFTAPTSA